MINGGFAGGGISKSSWRWHLKEVYQVRKSSLLPGHDDPVVITMILANANLYRTLIDQGSSADILFKPAFDKLGLEEKDLKAYPDSLFELGDTPIRPLSYISLYTTFRKGVKSRTLSINYIIVDVNVAYNALIGRMTLNRLAAVVSTRHLCMKFLTNEGIATIKGDQKLARKCYNEGLSLKSNSGGKEVNTIELGKTRIHEELRPQPEGKIEEVQIGDNPDKATSIGTKLKESLKKQLVDLLRKNSDLFAWKASDMPGIDPDLMSHKLFVYPGSRPVQ
ncbi:uncharacterized protein [Arachis hypogaea]|uniref:uncharacterized protein n=1 Tax=Arachis hypogaea TaxID=3818 RepID=UPI003B225886